MTMTIASAHQTIQTILTQLNTVLLGKEEAVQLSLACLLAKGHLLIEDLPGMGKTTLAHGLATVMGLDFQRVQFTSDLLPGDILGLSIYNPQSGDFTFRPGPIFTQILLADEVNRASPKTQSALLEAMAEYQVTIEGKTHDLVKPFFVIATQNSQHQTGTFPLPESQLDRFMMRLSLGYPSQEAERQLLNGINPQSRLAELDAVVDQHSLLALQRMVQNKVTANHQVIDYLQRLLAHIRENGQFSHGLSPRAALAWLNCAKAWALTHHRDHILPDDIQHVMLPVIGHRLLPGESEQMARQHINDVIQAVRVVV